MEQLHEWPINLGISDQDRANSIEALNRILAGEFVLLTQTLNYHWNLIGPAFHDYHLLFDDHYKTIFSKIDDIAERIRSVGGQAIGSMATILTISPIKEDSGPAPTSKVMIRNLLTQHEKLIQEIRSAINTTAENNRDIGTSNFLTDLIEKHEKIAWILRALAS